MITIYWVINPNRKVVGYLDKKKATKMKNLLNKIGKTKRYTIWKQ